MLNSDPPWLSCSLSHLRSSLSILTHDELHAAVLCISPCFTPRKHYDKLSCIDAILDHFEICRTVFSSCSPASIYACLHNLNPNVSSDFPCSLMITSFFEAAYGPLVASILCKSPWHAQDFYPLLDNTILNDMPWLADDLLLWMNRVPRKLPINVLKTCLCSMHLSMQPIFKAISKQSCWHAILRHLKQRGRFLFHQDDMFLLSQLICVRPHVYYP